MSRLCKTSFSHAGDMEEPLVPLIYKTKYDEREEERRRERKRGEDKNREREKGEGRD
jgi:hypothetical protein